MHFLVDTHCHLVADPLCGEVEALVAKALSAGIKRIINVAYCPTSSQKVLEHAQRFPEVFGAIGIQPFDSPAFSLESRALLEPLYDNPKVVAVGEIGLDNFYKDVPLEVQIPCFEYFLDLALSKDLPVIIHVRETHTEVHSRLAQKAAKGLKGVIHCFTGTWEECSGFLDLGFYISLSGIVTFKNAENLRSVAKKIPLNRLLIETDSPYLAPVPNRGKVNEPSNLIWVNSLLAQVLGRTPEELAQATTRNAFALFSRMAPLGET